VRALPATCGISRESGSGKAADVSRLGLLGKARAEFWRPEGGTADCGTRARRARGEPHRADVHWRSFGDFLFRALYEAGFASQPDSHDRDDGLRLRRCYITAALRCAPPANKPLPQELRNCQPYLESELGFLGRVRAVLALGRIGFDRYLSVVGEHAELPPRSKIPFAHGASYELPGGLPRLFASYHPSQQNTQTGKLTRAMMREVLADIDNYLNS